MGVKGMIFAYESNVKTATSLRNRARSARDTLNTCQKSGDENPRSINTECF